MLSTTSIFALVIAGCYAEGCGLYDGDGNLLGDVPHVLGYVSRDVESGSTLPGEVRLVNARAVSVETRNCPVRLDADGSRLTFTKTGEFGRESSCTVTLTVEGCPAAMQKEYKLMYYLEGFLNDSYVFLATFPVAKGVKLGDADIELSSLSFSTRVELEEDFDGLEIFPVGSTRDGIARFQLRTTKLLHLLDDLNLTMIGTDGVRTWKAPLTLRMTEDSAIPVPDFEERFYVVRLNASDLDSDRVLYRPGMIRLKQNYGRVSFDLMPVGDSDMSFELQREDGEVGVRLSEAPGKNLSCRDVVLQLTARVSNQFGHENEGFTTLLIRLDGDRISEDSLSPVLCDLNKAEDLKVVVIVLSVVIVLLLFVIIFLYFKYVCVRKPEPVAPCKKCSAPATVKTRRPTPRKISEYPYPLDVMPPPLETLAETEVEEEGGERLEVKVTTPTPAPKDEILAVPSTSGVKTRKRSMTFRESDEESRHHREAEVAVHRTERKASTESQRRVSGEEERRRRKSSVKMYRCLT